MTSIRINRIFLITTLLFFVSAPLMASSEVSSNFSHSYGMIALSGGLCIGLASTGGTFAQSVVAKAALEGMARNPEASGKVFVPMILSLALIESLVLFSLVISLNLIGKIV